MKTQLERQPSLSDQFRALKNTAIKEIREYGNPEYAGNPENTFDIALEIADSGISKEYPRGMVVSCLTITGVSETTALALLLVWSKMHRDHPEGMDSMN